MKQDSKTWDSIAPRKGEETMRMTNKMAQDTITDAIGEDSLPIVDFLKNRKNISEFIISEKTEIEIHQVRNILYRMHSMNLKKVIISVIGHIFQKDSNMLHLVLIVHA